MSLLLLVILGFSTAFTGFVMAFLRLRQKHKMLIQRNKTIIPSVLGVSAITGSLVHQYALDSCIKNHIKNQTVK